LEEKKRRGGVLVITLLMLSIIFFISSAYIFHSADVPEETYYDPEWFMQNSHARVPPKLPIVPYYWYNEAWPGYFFEIDGKAPNLAWRCIILNRYIEGQGWDLSFDTDNYVVDKVMESLGIGEYGQVTNFGTFETYSEKTFGNESFVVRTPPISTSFMDKYPLISLWDPEGEVSCSGFQMYFSSISRFTYNVSIYSPDDYLYVDFYTPESGTMGIMYVAYYQPRNYLLLAESSATIGETKTSVEGNPVLENYTLLPDGYVDDYPELRWLIGNVTLDDSESVYNQVSVILAFLYSNFELRYDLSVDRDPVADFVANGGGPPFSFVSTAAVVLRALGIPCRVVIGFVGGSYDPDIGRTIIGPDNIYVWLEVWDADNHWLSYEAMPDVSLAENLVPYAGYTIHAPRLIEGVPAAYEDEDIRIDFYLLGAGFELFDGTSVIFYDENESIEIGSIALTEAGFDVYIASISWRYEDIFALTGTLSYGVHVIEIRCGSIFLAIKVSLLRYTSIR